MLGIGSDDRALYDRLEDYFPRRLSYPTDAINAFAGIFDAFIKAKNHSINHYYGIPYLADRKLSNENYFLKVADATFALSLAWKVTSPCREYNCNGKTSTLNDEFPSWTWAASKVRHHHCEPGRLDFAYRGTSLDYHFDDPIRIKIHRQSGPGVELRFQETQSVSDLLPRLDITSMTISGTLCWSSKGRPMAFPPLRTAELLYTHLDAREIHGQVKAVYVGTIRSENGARSVFILVESLDSDLHRLIGNCSAPSYSSGWNGNFYNSASESLQSLTNGVEWTPQTLVLI